MSHSWQCPYCSHYSVISDDIKSLGGLNFDNNNKLGRLQVTVESITCTNPNCKEFTIEARLNETESYRLSPTVGRRLETWKLRPKSLAKPLPDYIPQAIKEDYAEACLIVGLSPKASATLARRCLQGMIRDFWEVKERNLFKEIEAIKSKIDPDVWEAIDAVRQIGNIGAHMEKDIDVIVEVDENEAGSLIKLIEMLIEEWYINDYVRKQRLIGIKQLGQDKIIQKKTKLESNSNKNLGSLSDYIAK